MFSWIRSRVVGFGKRFSTSNVDDRFLKTYLEHYNTPELRHIFRRPVCRGRKIVEVSAKEFMNFFCKLPKRDYKSQYKSLENVLISENISVSDVDPNKPLLEEPICRVAWRNFLIEGWFKMNTDASFLIRNESNGKKIFAGGGVIIRDDSGDISLAECFPLDNVMGSFEAEFETVRRGLIIALAYGCRKVVIEGDSKKLLNYMKGVDHVPEDYYDKFLEIDKYLSYFEDYEINFIYREGNRVANHLASIPRLLSDGASAESVWAYLHILHRLDMEMEPYYRVPMAQKSEATSSEEHRDGDKKD